MASCSERCRRAKAAASAPFSRMLVDMLPVPSGSIGAFSRLSSTRAERRSPSRSDPACRRRGPTETDWPGLTIDTDARLTSMSPIARPKRVGAWSIANVADSISNVISGASADSGESFPATAIRPLDGLLVNSISV